MPYDAIEVQHCLTCITQVREDLAARAQRLQVSAVNSQCCRQHRDRSLTLAELPDCPGQFCLDHRIVGCPVYGGTQLGYRIGKPPLSQQ